MSCDRRLLSEYLDGELSPRDRRRAEAHLADCVDCRAVIQQYRDLGAALRDLEVGRAPASLRAQFYARRRARPAAPTGRPIGSAAPAWSRAPASLGALGTLAAALLVALSLGLLSGRPASRLEVVAVYPADGATEVVLDEPIAVELSSALDPGAVELAVRLDPEVAVESAVEGRRLVVRPREPLKPDTRYVVSIEPRQVASPAATAAPPVTLNFSTGRSSTGRAAAAVPTPTTSRAVAAAPAPATPPPAAAPLPPVGPAPLAAPAPSVTPLLPTPTRPAPVVAAAALTALPTLPPPTTLSTGPAPCAAGPGPSLVRALGGKLDRLRRLGCALAAESVISVVEQRFQGGQMLALSDRRETLVLYASGRWARYSDGPRPGPSPTPPPVAGPALARAFSRLWLELPEVRGQLGPPLAAEQSWPAAVQSFAGGLALADAAGVRTLHDDGTWQTTPTLPGTPAATVTAGPTGGGRTAASPAPTPRAPLPGATTTPTFAVVDRVAEEAPDAPPPPTPPAGATATPADPVLPALTKTPTAALPLDSAAACDVPVARGFAAAYTGEPGLRERLGCAVAPEHALQGAIREFESGLTYRRADVRTVYVLYDDGTWVALADGGRGADAAATGGEATEPGAEAARPSSAGAAPPDALRRLGAPLGAELALDGLVQPFQRGLLLQGSGQRVYVLLSAGTWQSPTDERRQPER